MGEPQKVSASEEFINRFQKVPINEDLKKLIKAIYALIPSRNMVSQLIMLLPLKEEVIQELFPELVEDIEYWNIFSAALGFDRSFSGDVSHRYNALSHVLRDFIIKIFEILRDEKTRVTLSSMMGELLPDPEREWLEVRIKAVLRNQTISDIAKKMLMLLIEQYNVDIKELPSKLNTDEHEINQCIYVLKNLKLVEVHGDNLVLSSDVVRHSSYVKRLLKEVEK